MNAVAADVEYLVTANDVILGTVGRIDTAVPAPGSLVALNEHTVVPACEDGQRVPVVSVISRNAEGDRIVLDNVALDPVTRSPADPDSVRPPWLACYRLHREPLNGHVRLVGGIDPIWRAGKREWSVYDRAGVGAEGDARCDVADVGI